MSRFSWISKNFQTFHAKIHILSEMCAKIWKVFIDFQHKSAKFSSEISEISTLGWALRHIFWAYTGLLSIGEHPAQKKSRLFFGIFFVHFWNFFHTTVGTVLGRDLRWNRFKNSSKIIFWIKVMENHDFGALEMLFSCTRSNIVCRECV